MGKDDVLRGFIELRTTEDMGEGGVKKPRKNGDVLYTVGFKSIEIGKKVLHSFDHVFHVYLMSGLQKYAKKKKFTSPF